MWGDTMGRSIFRVGRMIDCALCDRIDTTETNIACRLCQISATNVNFLTSCSKLSEGLSHERSP